MRWTLQQCNNLSCITVQKHSNELHFSHPMKCRKQFSHPQVKAIRRSFSRQHWQYLYTKWLNNPRCFQPCILYAVNFFNAVLAFTACKFVHAMSFETSSRACSPSHGRGPKWWLKFRKVRQITLRYGYAAGKSQENSTFNWLGTLKVRPFTIML